MTQNNQNNLEENNVTGLKLTHFKAYYELTVIKTVYYLNKERHIGQ